MGYQPEFIARLAANRAALRQELAALFPGPCAIVWEIGSGHGHFLVHYAQEFPDKVCVGVDVVLDRFERSGRKRERARLSNCHFVRAEAREFLQALPPWVILREIWVLFPDPWPKKRHHKNRIMQPDFLEAAAGRAGEGVPLYFRTDHLAYFQTVADFLPSLNTWSLQPGAPWPLDHETVFQSRATAYRSLVAVRTSHPARPAGTADTPPPPPVGPR